MSAPAAHPSPWPTWLAVAILVAFTIGAYSTSFAGVFVLDDEPAIVENPHLRQWWPLSAAMAAPPGTTLSGRPLVALTFALNYALAPDDARDVMRLSTDASPEQRERLWRNLWGYHALNLLIHLAAALTLFAIVRRTLLTWPADNLVARHRTGLAWCTALLWSVHPLTTSAVTYVIQRAESLMALCLLVTLYCSIRAWQGPIGWTVGAVIACALGMASKEAMVVAPLLVIIWDAVFSEARQYWLALWRRRWPLYLGLAATWGVLALLVAGGHRPEAAGFAFPEWPWWRYLATQAQVIAHYLRLALVPSPLVLDYDWPPAPLSAAVLPALLLSGLAITSVVLLVRRRPLGFAGVAFFLLLAPTSSVLPIVTEVAAEHRMYLPLASIVAVLVIGTFVLGQRIGIGRWGAIAVGLLAIVFASLTLARNRDYHRLETIWRDTVEKRPANARAQHNYATTLLTQGRFPEAEAHLRLALQQQPRHAEAHAALGVALAAQGRVDDGITHLETALQIAPRFASAEQSLGEAYASRGQMAGAVDHYGRALALQGDDPVLLNRLAWILATDPRDDLRDGARALALAGRATELTARRDVTSLDTLAAARAEQRQFPEAIAAAGEALALAEQQGLRDYVPELAHRLQLYREQRPFRSPR